MRTKQNGFMKLMFVNELLDYTAERRDSKQRLISELEIYDL